MFIVTFVIMLPIKLKTGDPIRGWEAGLTLVFIQSFVLMIGGFVAPVIRGITPRAAVLGTLAGVSIAFIAMRPALDRFMTPMIGLTCFAVILASWFGGVGYGGGPSGGFENAPGRPVFPPANHYRLAAHGPPDSHPAPIRRDYSLLNSQSIFTAVPFTVVQVKLNTLYIGTNPYRLVDVETLTRASPPDLSNARSTAV